MSRRTLASLKPRSVSRWSAIRLSENSASPALIACGMPCSVQSVGPVAALAVAVLDVVVDEAEVVAELDGRGARQGRAVVAGDRRVGEQAEERPHPLAARRAGAVEPEVVADHLVHARGSSGRGRGRARRISSSVSAMSAAQVEAGLAERSVERRSDQTAGASSLLARPRRAFRRRGGRSRGGDDRPDSSHRPRADHGAVRVVASVRMPSRRPLHDRCDRPVPLRPRRGRPRPDAAHPAGTASSRRSRKGIRRPDEPARRQSSSRSPSCAVALARGRTFDVVTQVSVGARLAAAARLARVGRDGVVPGRARRPVARGAARGRRRCTPCSGAPTSCSTPGMAPGPGGALVRDAPRRRAGRAAGGRPLRRVRPGARGRRGVPLGAGAGRRAVRAAPGPPAGRVGAVARGAQAAEGLPAAGRRGARGAAARGRRWSARSRPALREFVALRARARARSLAFLDEVRACRSRRASVAGGPSASDRPAQPPSTVPATAGPVQRSPP